MNSRKSPAKSHGMKSMHFTTSKKTIRQHWIYAKYTESHRWCSLALQFTARSPSPRKVKATHRLPHREQMAEWELEIRCPDVPYTALSTAPQNSLNPGTRYHVKRLHLLNVFHWVPKMSVFKTKMPFKQIPSHYIFLWTLEKVNFHSLPGPRFEGSHTHKMPMLVKCFLQE